MNSGFFEQTTTSWLIEKTGGLNKIGSLRISRKGLFLFFFVRALVPSFDRCCKSIVAAGSHAWLIRSSVWTSNIYRSYVLDPMNTAGHNLRRQAHGELDRFRQGLTAGGPGHFRMVHLVRLHLVEDSAGFPVGHGDLG